MRLVASRAASIISVLILAGSGCRQGGGYRVPGGGMEPTIAIGQSIGLDRAAYRSPADVKRGDVVVFEAPTPAKNLMVKRVVGLPGERVSATAGLMSINGSPLPLSTEGDVTIEHGGPTQYRVRFTSPCHESATSAEVMVPAGAFFLVGDNRCASLDSRRFGPVAFAAIRGKARLE